MKVKILNPFALPPETTARFVLLLVSVIMISLILGNYLPLYFMSDQFTENLLSPKVDFNQTGIETPADLKDSGMRMIRDSLEYVPSVIILFLIFLLTFLISYYLYRKHADKIVSKQDLKPAGNSGENKYSHLQNEIRRMSNLYGIEPPEIYVSPRFSTGAQVFGFKNKNMIRIDNGLRLMMVKDRDKFESIILHELAHIKNDDVSKTYFAGSLWKVVLYMFAIPTLLLIIMSFIIKTIKILSEGFAVNNFKDILFKSIPVMIILIFSLTVFFLIIYLLLKSLVRIREFYADRRAAAAGAGDELLSLFKANSFKEKKVTGIKKLFSWHPQINERIDSLADPSGLFVVKKDLSFIVGLLMPFSLFSVLVLGRVAISLSGIFSGVSQMLSQNLTVTFLTVTAGILIFVFVCFVPFFVTSFLISSSMGLQIQKNVIASFDTGNIRKFGLKEILTTSFIITLGMIAGSLILPYYSILNLLFENSLKEIVTDKIPVVILTLMFAFTVNFLWVFYLKFNSGILYGRYLKGKPPAIRYFVFNLVSAALLSLMILPVAGIYFRIYSNDIDFLNETVNTLLYFLPVIYFVIFAMTGLVIRIMNAGNSVCQDCGSPLPSGNLIGKECSNCHSVFSKWLYV